MFEFVKVTKIVGLMYSFVFDNMMTIASIRDTHKSSINVKFLLVLKDPIDNVYNVDISKLMTDEILPVEIVTVQDMIDNYLSSEDIYSYHTTLFVFDNNVKFLQESDIPGSLSINSYSTPRDSISPIYDDPHYPDLKFSSGIDMTRMFPIVGGLLRKSRWEGESIIVSDAARIVYDKDTDGFLSFQNATDIRTFTLREIIDNDWVIPDIVDGEEKYMPVVVLGGLLIHNEPDVISFSSEYRKLVFNESLLMQQSSFSSYVDFNSLADDPTSFIIMVSCSNIFKRVIDLTNFIANLSDFYFDNESDNAINYFCTNDVTRVMRRFAMLTEDFVKTIPGINSDGLPHHNSVYVEINVGDNNNFSLNQLSLV